MSKAMPSYASPEWLSWLSGVVDKATHRAMAEERAAACAMVFDPSLPVDRTHVCGRGEGHRGSHLCLDCGTEWADHECNL